MVVLAMALVPNPEQAELAKVLGIPVDANGFYQEQHYKIGAVDTGREGVYVAGCAQGARDIADTVAHASAAASRVQVLLSRLARRAA
jgi:heterodisulfide reductase subunit A